MGLTERDLAMIIGIFHWFTFESLAEQVLRIIKKTYENKFNEQTGNLICYIKKWKISQKVKLTITAVNIAQSSRSRVFGLPDENNEILPLKVIDYKKKIKMNVKIIKYKNVTDFLQRMPVTTHLHLQCLFVFSVSRTGRLF